MKRIVREAVTLVAMSVVIMGTLVAARATWKPSQEQLAEYDS